MWACVIEDKTTVVVVVASCRSVSRNPVCFKALTYSSIEDGTRCNKIVWTSCNTCFLSFCFALETNSW